MDFGVDGKPPLSSDGYLGKTRSLSYNGATCKVGAVFDPFRC